MNTVQIFMRKFSVVAAILIPLLLLSCAEYMMLDSEVKEDFKPTEFAKDNQPVIEESVKLGPRPNTKTDTALRPDRRIFIDESIMTDYTKIIDKIGISKATAVAAEKSIINSSLKQTKD